jgi:hypothetical protein
MNARVWVEVGAAWGAMSRHMLRHATTIQEYHIVDPFRGGYDAGDPMSKQFAMAVANRSFDEISRAWADHIGWALGTSAEASAGCQLRIHRVPSVEGAKLFANRSVDVVFVDGLHTYEGVRDDIAAWASKTTQAGALVFNDFPVVSVFPGIQQAVHEEAERRGHNFNHLRFINAERRDNAVLGGDPKCAEMAPPSTTNITTRKGGRWRQHQPALCYALRYKDLYSKYCQGDLSLCNITKLESHWLSNGQRAGRTFGCNEPKGGATPMQLSLPNDNKKKNKKKKDKKKDTKKNNNNKSPLSML